MAREIHEGDIVRHDGAEWLVREVCDDRERMLRLERGDQTDYQPRRNVRLVGEQTELFGDGA